MIKKLHFIDKTSILSIKYFQVSYLIHSFGHEIKKYGI